MEVKEEDVATGTLLTTEKIINEESITTTQSLMIDVQAVDPFIIINNHVSVMIY